MVLSAAINPSGTKHVRSGWPRTRGHVGPDESSRRLNRAPHENGAGARHRDLALFGGEPVRDLLAALRTPHDLLDAALGRGPAWLQPDLDRRIRIQVVLVAAPRTRHAVRRVGRGITAGVEDGAETVADHAESPPGWSSGAAARASVSVAKHSSIGHVRSEQIQPSRSVRPVARCRYPMVASHSGHSGR